jgi:hypothetical protein
MCLFRKGKLCDRSMQKSRLETAHEGHGVVRPNFSLPVMLYEVLQPRSNHGCNLLGFQLPRRLQPLKVDEHGAV